DTNGDLLDSSPELTGDYAIFQGVSFTVPAGATGAGIFRARWTLLNTASATPLETQAREITCTSWKGNYTNNGYNMLCINGQNQCASVNPGNNLNITLAS